MKIKVAWARVGVVVAAASMGFANLAGADSRVDFKRDIQPIFEKNCIACHTSQAPQGGLIMESLDSLFKGGKKEGPSVIAGNSRKSPLVRSLRGETEPRMPMGSDPLSQEQIERIAIWIDELGQPESKAKPTETASQASSGHRFEQEIKPLLEQNCFACHSSEKHKSGLVLENLSSILRGGALQGPSVIAGLSEKSPLIQRLRGAKEPRMPMNGQPLSEQQIARIAKWINELEAPTLAEVTRDSKKLSWPWTPVAEPVIPEVKRKEWVRNPIDAFVLAKLERRQMEPAPPVSKRGLLRRLYFSLIGLPPTPEDMERFLKDDSPDAYARETEKLLADSRYGERWGRHWLDLVRYSDTRGGAIDYPRPHMWRYRDYVIRAFNQDRPYDRFIKEQIAADAFPTYGDEGKLGLGFLGQWVAVEAEGEQVRRDYVVDVVNTTGSVFLGVTLGCARCHNHKYDPIPTKDYYRIESFFSPMNVDLRDAPFHQYEMPRLQVEHWKKAAKEWEQLLAERKKAADQFEEQIKKRKIEHQILWSTQDLKDWSDPGQRKLPFPSDTLLSQEDKDRQKLIGRQTARFANPNSPDYYLPKAYMVNDSELQNTVATYVLTGGNYKLRSEEVKPGFLSAISGEADGPDLDGLNGSRRQLLAKWIASRENPLTARVMVNRIWQYHFGKGLVATPSDFGKNGVGTVHQDLIDWMAWRFMESGWSIKEIHRLILSSNVYQQSMKHPRAQEQDAIDSDNQHLWVRDPVRIEVESIRDSVLAVSGQLNPLMGGPPFFPEANDEQMARASTWWESSSRTEQSRRAVYMLQIRSFQLPMVKVFDGANMDESCVVRGVTSVTPQVFALFNSKFAYEQSQEMASRLIAEAGNNPEKQIERAFQLAFQRPPSKSEKEKSLAFLSEFLSKPPVDLSLKKSAYIQATDTQAVQQPSGEAGALADLCLILFNMNEFIFLE
ncbi:MAG: DUF1553 domain-containing protein [Acidobacteria bacterium]|nr:DUF1553 domain-containing protein [Acidobacteriota bacterium]